MLYAFCLTILAIQIWLGCKVAAHWFNEQQDERAASSRRVNILFACVMLLSVLPALLLLPWILLPFFEFEWTFVPLTKTLVLTAAALAWIPLAVWSWLCPESQAQRPLLYLQAVNIVSACFEAGLIFFVDALSHA